MNFNVEKIIFIIRLYLFYQFLGHSSTEIYFSLDK